MDTKKAIEPQVGSPGTNSNGQWLSSEGPYQAVIEKGIALNPGLRYPDPRNRDLETRVGTSRLVLLKLPSDESPSYVVQQELGTVEEAKIHFEQPRTTSHCRIYLLEALDPDFVQLLGSHFSIDPSFFLRHERYPRLEAWDRENHRVSETPSLPTLVNLSQFTLRYPEMRFFGNDHTYYRNICAVTGRPILTIGFEGRLDLVGTICRKCSFWSKSYSDVSWDVVILCDPPLRRIIQQSRRKRVKILSGEPYQGGYLDFLKREVFAPDQTRGPPRTGFLDDLCFYIKEVLETNPVLLKSPGNRADSISMVTACMKKIVASEYMRLLDYFEGVVRKLRDSEWRLAGMGDYSDPRRGAAQEQWGSLHVCSHRLGEHVDDVEAILVNLDMPLVPPAPLLDGDWMSSERDFQYIYHRLKTLKARCENLVTSTIGLAGIVGNKQALREAELSLKEARRSIREAKSVKTLTVVAMFFIPLAFTSGLFSMSDQYTPGAKHFWIYFAVSIPLIIFTFGAVGFMQLGYDDAAVWSFKTLQAAFVRLRKGDAVEDEKPETEKARYW